MVSLALSAAVVHDAPAPRAIPALQYHQQGNTTASNGSRCLSPDAIQTASILTGQEEGTKGIYDGQSPSKVDNNNFINFCAGQPLTNGRQLSTSSCNGIPMGRLPAKTNLVSSIITSPTWSDSVPAHATFNVTIQTAHLRAGFLVNPLTNYYTAPQDLDENGDVKGHCHITIQVLPRAGSSSHEGRGMVPDAAMFVFFKGVDDPVSADGQLQATVSGGLPAGAYRVCTMIAAQNHQPVAMPVAQRGAQDDCVRFHVV
ncbi:hypothetical protein SEUCBS140593_006200 [Sporothrix eucalyptigena]|uniref:Uncharacterized protein n=1 Tax=Sporothrix eucalyptigena TaxID=1812306 RepID=A0ABP0C2U4_9PEZI